MNPFSEALAEAAALEAKGLHAEAARRLDAALAAPSGTPGGAEDPAGAAARFRALVVRADLACSLGDLIESRGILAEARQVRLDARGKAEASTEIDRADALETFLTHRGCAG